MFDDRGVDVSTLCGAAALAALQAESPNVENRLGWIP